MGKNMTSRRAFESQQRSKTLWAAAKVAVLPAGDVVMRGILRSMGKQGEPVDKEYALTRSKLLELRGHIVACEAVVSWATVSVLRSSAWPGFTITYRSEVESYYVADIREWEKWGMAWAQVAVLQGLEEEIRVAGVLGRGGQSTVYLGTSNPSGETVAIKSYDKLNLFQCPKKLQSLAHEIDILRSLNHPNIPKLLRVYESEVSVDLVLEYCSGCSLAASLERPFSQEEAKQFMLELFDTLQYLSSQQVIHRDLQPGNFLLPEVSDRTRFKLIDFGFAQRFRGFDLTDDSGSPGFFAPEVLLKRPHGPAVDIYAAGVLFYTLVAGFNPFLGSSTARTLDRNMNNEIAFTKVWKEVDPKFECMVRVMTSFNPELRMNWRALKAWLKCGKQPTARTMEHQASLPDPSSMKLKLVADELKEALRAAQEFRERRSSQLLSAKSSSHTDLSAALVPHSSKLGFGEV